VERSPKQALLSYCSLRLEETIVENTVEVLDAVAGQITNFLHELEKRREVLGLLGASFVALPASNPGASETLLCLPNLTELLPGRCQNVADAAQKLLRSLEPELRQPFEQALQTEVLTPNGGLWSLARGTGEGLQ